jgi:hypothetical protein
MRDKFRDLCVRENGGPGMVELLPKWMTACKRSAKDHLIGCNSKLGLGSTLELLLTKEEDKKLLWEVCDLAQYAWLKDLWRLLGNNSDLGLQPAAYTASLNAGASDLHCFPQSTPEAHGAPTEQRHEGKRGILTVYFEGLAKEGVGDMQYFGNVLGLVANPEAENVCMTMTPNGSRGLGEGEWEHVHKVNTGRAKPSVKWIQARLMKDAMVVSQLATHADARPDYSPEAKEKVGDFLANNNLAAIGRAKGNRSSSRAQLLSYYSEGAAADAFFRTNIFCALN